VFYFSAKVGVLAVLWEFYTSQWKMSNWQQKGFLMRAR
jgi:hypothetical protein